VGRAPLAKPPREDQPDVVGLPPEVAGEYGVLLRGYRTGLNLLPELGADGTPLDVEPHDDDHDVRQHHE
jgi:hypothetical protein